MFSFSIILRERRAETGVDQTEDNGVGEHLDEVTLTGREGQKHSRGEDDKKDDGDNNVEVHVYSISFKNISQSNITLMVKPLVALASRAIRANKEIVPCLVRIQNGFMTDTNIRDAERILQELHDMLRDMRAQSTQPKDDTFLPLK